MESLVKLEEVREGFDRQGAFKPVDVRFEEFNGNYFTAETRRTQRKNKEVKGQ